VRPTFGPLEHGVPPRYLSVQRRLGTAWRPRVYEAFSSPKTLTSEPLTPRVHPRAFPVETGSRRELGIVSPTSRQGSRFPDPEAPSIDRYSPKPAFAGVRLDWEPATGPAAWPRASRLLTLVHSQRSRAEELDPPSGSTSSSLVAETGRAPPVDFCNRCEHEHDCVRPNPTAPHLRSPAGAAVLSPLTSRWSTSCGWQCFLSVASPAERSRARGLGSRRRGLEAWLLSPRSLAERASPQPDRLGHLMSPAHDERRLERPTSSETAFAVPFRARPASDALASPPPTDPLPRTRRTGPHPAIPREEERVPPHPRCLPSPDSPRARGSPAVHKLSPTCGFTSRRLFDRRASRVHDGNS
jgi:hypothetical protein